MKKLLVVFLTLFSSISFSNNYQRIVNCEMKSATGYENLNQRCIKINIESEKYACQAKAFQHIVFNSCVENLQKNAQTLVSLSEELSFVNKLFESNILTKNAYLEKHNQLVNMRNEQQRFTLKQLDNVMNGLEADYNERRNQIIRNNALSVLSGSINQFQNHNSIQNENYIINGRMISCIKNGTIINCQ